MVTREPFRQTYAPRSGTTPKRFIWSNVKVGVAQNLSDDEYYIAFPY